MFSLPYFVRLVIISIFGRFSSTSATNSLSGRHLRAIWPLWSGNPKGLSGPLKGGVVLDYLSNRLNFTYEMVRVTENRLEPPANGRGLFSYLFDKQCDLIVYDVLPTVPRNQMVDLTTYWIYGDNGFLIPVSDETANINGVIKPFQWPVWLGLCVSLAFVMVVLYLMRHCPFARCVSGMQRHSQSKESPKSDQSVNDKSHSVGDPRVAKEEIEKEYLYVLGTLLSQGIPFKSKRLSFRMVAGVWTLAAFFFVQIYNSTLITYIITPVSPPLMSTVRDIIDDPSINVFIKMAGVSDTLLLTLNDSGMYAKLRRKLDSSPDSRCNLASQCISLITPGSRNVYIDGRNYLKDVIKADFTRTGKCNLQIAKEIFMPLYVTFALPKNSPYTKSISSGLLSLHQTGLIDFWDTWFRPMPPQCTGNIKSGNGKSKNKNSPLSLKNLTGTFLVFIVGLSLSIVAFILEQIVSIPKRHRRRTFQPEYPINVVEVSPNTAEEEPSFILD